MSLPHNDGGFNGMMYSNDNVGMVTASNTSSNTATWPEEQQQQQQQQQQPVQNDDKLTHPEWGVMKEQDFHPLTLKHQVDLENSHQSGNLITDFYFWQANLGGYCMANMAQSECNLNM
ncbi:unnamed protein product [Mucor hiemalis]